MQADVLAEPEPEAEITYVCMTPPLRCGACAETNPVPVANQFGQSNSHDSMLRSVV